jgi:hypothetical protein
MGMIPNLAGAMAESPQLLEGFLKVREILYGGIFTPAEVQVLGLVSPVGFKSLHWVKTKG